MCEASALPARLCASGPGNMSGKMVSTVARHIIYILGYSLPGGGTTTIFLAAKSTFGTAVSVKVSISATPLSGVISMMSPAPKLWIAVTVPIVSPSAVTAAIEDDDTYYHPDRSEEHTSE